MSRTVLKQLPSFATDEEAERFVGTADLSEYDLSGFVPLSLTLNEPKDETYVLIPRDLAADLRKKAQDQGVAFATAVREALERGLTR